MINNIFLYIRRLNNSGFPWIFMEPKNCYRWFPMISGHRSERLLSMGFEILGLDICQTKDWLGMISMYLWIVPNIDLHLHIWKFVNHLQNKVFHSFTSENNNIITAYKLEKTNIKQGEGSPPLPQLDLVLVTQSTYSYVVFTSTPFIWDASLEQSQWGGGGGLLSIKAPP